MKRRIYFFASIILIFLLSEELLYSQISDSVKQYKLENNLDVFFVEDRTTPFIRIEFATKAGFSYQTQSTNGFFKLYTYILKNKFTDFGLNIETAECNADSSRYIFFCTPSEIDYYCSKIAELMFFTTFTTEEIEKALESLKAEINENYNSLEGLINSAIDSRVFYESPWKHDTGIYPAIFSKISIKTIRSILSEISEKFYTPQNSALFINGNITESFALNISENNFGIYSTNNYIQYDNKKTERLNQSINTQRKYVIHDPEFSSDLLQLVVQYNSLNMEECEVVAKLLNHPYSSFKTSLLNIPELNILGNEYINISAAHKKNESRLIIQTLMQPPENYSTKEKGLFQSQLFETSTKSCFTQIREQEFYNAQYNCLYNIEKTQVSTNYFMDTLSSYWALEPYQTVSEESINISTSDKSLLVQNLLSKKELYRKTTLSEMQSKLSSEEPFIFVIMNSSDYSKLKKEFKNNGYEEITRKNAFWNLQKNFSDIIKNPYTITDNHIEEFKYKNEELAFIKTNKESIIQTQLSNNIPLIMKKNDFSNETSILISIKGGKLASANNNGFEEVMINLIAENIKNQIYESINQGVIFGKAEVESNTDITSSKIIITCDNNEIDQICKCISDGIIYAEIKPAQADKAVSSRQYKKRLENGSDVNQMLDFAISHIYPKTDIEKVFEYKDDILMQSDYQSILAAYPDLLDASRYTIFICGQITDKTISIFDKTLGLLSNQNTKLNFQKYKWDFEKKQTLTIPITHTFLTDIPAEQAGPMPAILIPTTEFFDPVIYAIKTPDFNENQKEYIIFNSMLNYINELLQKEINNNKRAKGSISNIKFSPALTDVAFLIVQKVPHTKEIDALYKKVIINLKKTFSGNNNEQNINSNIILQQITDSWIKNQFYNWQDNKTQVQQMHKGIELLQDTNHANLYLDEFECIINATIQDYANILSYFDDVPQLRLYSATSKK